MRFTTRVILGLALVAALSAGVAVSPAAAYTSGVTCGGKVISQSYARYWSSAGTREDKLCSQHYGLGTSYVTTVYRLYAVAFDTRVSASETYHYYGEWRNYSWKPCNWDWWDYTQRRWFSIYNCAFRL